MTEVADQFTEERSGEVARISHWIDGQRVEIMRDYTVNQPGVVGDLPNETGGQRRVFLTTDQSR